MTEGVHVSLGAQQKTEANTDRLRQEASAQLARARGFVALAQRYACKLPPSAEDREKSQMALAEATKLCVAASQSAKANTLFQLVDSGLNPSEFRRSIQYGLSPQAESKGQSAPGRARLSTDNRDQISVSLFAQLDACRRMNLEGIRCQAQSDDDTETRWRGQQLLKIAEQLCVITALESKLFGRYVLGDPTDDPAAVRQAVNDWATEATRRELAGE